MMESVIPSENEASNRATEVYDYRNKLNIWRAAADEKYL